MGVPPPGVGAPLEDITPFTSHDSFHGPNPPPRGCVRWWDSMYLAVTFFHFGSKSSSAGVLLRMAGLGMGYSTEFVCIFFRNQKGESWRGGRGGEGCSLVRPSFPTREPEEAGDTRSMGGWENRSQGEPGSRQAFPRFLKDCEGTSVCGGRKQQMN